MKNMQEDFNVKSVPVRDARALHHDSLVIDMHSDAHVDVIRARGQGETHVIERRHLPKWRQGGLDAVVLNTIPKFGPDPYPYRTSPLRNALLTMDAIHQEIAESAEQLMLVLESEDIMTARRAGKIGVIIGMEGAEAVESDLGILRAYHGLGLRVMNITWHQRNFAADGVAEPSGAGLSHFGRALIKEMNRLGIVIDVSHLAPAGIDDVLSLSDAPVLASHSNAAALCAHNRNLDDRLITAIAAAGGMIGVVFLGRFVASASPTIDDVLNHVDHIVRLAGSEGVGIGPDYVDFAHDMIIGSRRAAGPGQPTTDTTIPYAAGLEDVSLLPRFTEGLVRRGRQEREIRGILGLNFLNLFKRIRSGQRQ